MSQALEASITDPRDNISQFLTTIFNRLDVDRSGTLDKYEIKLLFRTAMDEMELEDTQSDHVMTDHNLDILLNRIDTDGDGQIDLSEFTKAFDGVSSLEDLIDTSYLHLLFSKIDKDGSDTLQHDEILSLFDDAPDMTPLDKQNILHSIDKNNDGVITFDEFKSAFRSLNCKSEHDIVQKSYLKLIFNQLDANQNRVISIDEWRQLFTDQNIVFSEQELYRLIEVFDQDGDGNIDFYEFEQAFTTIQSIPDLIKKSRLHVIFNSIDTDHSNALEFDEIKSLFVQENMGINDENIRFLIDIIDKDGDGCIDFGEFEDAFDEIESIDQLITKWSQLKSVDVGSDLSISAAIHCTSDAATDTNAFTCALPLLAGGTAGICSRTVTAPLERVKIMAQCGTTNQSVVGTCKQIIHRQGCRGLWRGNMLNCLRVFPFGGLVTFSYGNLTKMMPSSMDEKTMYIMRFAAGVAAGGLATTVTYPLDLLRTQLQASWSSETQTNMGDIAGFRNMFKGLWPTLFAMSLFVGAQNTCYDYLRLNATSVHGLGLKPSIELFIGCGMTAGLIAQTVVYPIDVIRRRIQVNSESLAIINHASSNVHRLQSIGTISITQRTSVRSMLTNTTWLALQNVVAKEGIRSIFAGLVPTYLKTIPSVAISVTVRDILLGRLQPEQE